MTLECLSGFFSHFLQDLLVQTYNTATELLDKAIGDSDWDAVLYKLLLAEINTRFSVFHVAQNGSLSSSVI